MAAQEDPKLTSSHRHTQSTTTDGTIPSEKSKLAEQVFHNKWEKGHIEIGTRDRDRILPKIPPPKW